MWTLSFLRLMGMVVDLQWCVFCCVNEVCDFGGEEGYFVVDVFGQIEVSDCVFVNGSVVAAFTDEGYAATALETECDLKEVDMRLHVVFFAAL